MNPNLKSIFSRAESWPEGLQEEAARFLLALEQEYAEP
jgi:hypothetical protein